MRLSIEVNTGRLMFDPVNNRRTLYACITLFNTVFWVQWWDTDRCGRHSIRFCSIDKLMCLTSGIRKG